MNNQSNTPRTDKEASYGWSGDAICVSAVFARQLETELADANKRADEWKRMAEELADRLFITDNHVLKCVGKTQCHHINKQTLAKFDQMKGKL